MENDMQEKLDNALHETLLEDGSSPEKARYLKKLLDLGARSDAADVQGRYPLHYAAAKGNLPALETLLGAGARAGVADGNGDTPLHVAARCGHEAVAKALVAAGAEAGCANACGKTPLYLAAEKGHLSIVKFLALCAGAGVDAGDKGGSRPMHRAASGGHVKVMEFLHERGAPICGEDGKIQPMHLAAAFNRMDAVQFLLGKGVRVDVRDEYGRKPLHYAAMQGSIEMVKHLVMEMNDNPWVKDVNGKTPGCLAGKGCHAAGNGSDVRDFLKQWKPPVRVLHRWLGETRPKAPSL